MHGSGIHVSESNKRAFADFQRDSNQLFLKFQIKDDSFITTAQGNVTASKSDDFKAIQKILDEEAAYIAARVKGKDKLLFIFYMPENSKVRDRMIYASSTNLLKDGLGAANFAASNFAIAAKAECALHDYEESIAETDHATVMTVEEKVKAESEVSAAKAMSAVKVSAIMDLPVKATDDVLSAIQGTQSSFTTAILFLHGETEVLHLESKGSFSFDEVARKLPEKEPRFILSRYSHDNDGKQAVSNIFIYYCPEGSKQKAKMFYSTSKSVVLKICEAQGVKIDKNIEVSDPKEINDNYVLDELYPTTSEKKSFKKAAKPGKGKNRLIGGAKFSAE